MHTWLHLYLNPKEHWGFYQQDDELTEPKDAFRL